MDQQCAPDDPKGAQQASRQQGKAASPQAPRREASLDALLPVGLPLLDMLSSIDNDIYRYLNEFQKTQNMGDSGVTVVAKEAAQNWKMMSEAEREVCGSFFFFNDGYICL